MSLIYYVKTVKAHKFTDAVMPSTKHPKMKLDAPIDYTTNLVLTEDEAKAIAATCQERRIPYGFIRAEDAKFMARTLTEDEAKRFLNMDFKTNVANAKW